MIQQKNSAAHNFCEGQLSNPQWKHQEMEWLWGADAWWKYKWIQNQLTIFKIQV